MAGRARRTRVGVCAALPPVGDLLARLESEPLLAEAAGAAAPGLDSRVDRRGAGRSIRAAARRDGLPGRDRAGLGRSSCAVDRVVRSPGSGAGGGAIPGRRRARVVNATGVLLHTNLGRAPLPASAVRALSEAAGGYSNLEMDLESGRRCSRLEPLRRLLPLVTGAEAGIAVHNNAAAVYLALTALAAGREVVVSRGHLVEIGGSFRLPEIMAASGARLREVGSTNRTRLSDYEAALSPGHGAPPQGPPEQLPPRSASPRRCRRGIWPRSRTGTACRSCTTSAAGRCGRTASWPSASRPSQAALEDGADLVCFSGDKLLGGPQAGILVGKRAWIERLSKHPRGARGAARQGRAGRARRDARGLARSGHGAHAGFRSWRSSRASEAELEEMAASRWRSGCAPVLPAPWIIDTAAGPVRGRRRNPARRAASVARGSSGPPGARRRRGGARPAAGRSRGGRADRGRPRAARRPGAAARRRGADRAAPRRCRVRGAAGAGNGVP